MSDVNENSENIDCLWWGLPAGNFPCDASPIEAVSFAVVCGGISLLFVAFLMKNLRYHQRGNDEMNKISDKIKSGSRAFLVTEYKYLAIFVVIMFLLLFMLYALNPLSTNQWTDGIRYGLSFLSGAVLSAIAGWGGMLAATDANVRTTQAAEKNGLPAALRVAFTGGSVAGFTVVGLGILGVSLTFFCLTLGYST